MKLLLASLAILMSGCGLVAVRSETPLPTRDPLVDARANPRNACEAALTLPAAPDERAADAAKRTAFDTCSYAQMVAAISYLGMEVQVPSDYVTWECSHHAWLAEARLCREIRR